MFGRLALHTWTLDTTPLAQAIAAAKAGGFDAIELRRIDFVRGHHADLSNEAVQDIVWAGGLPVHMMSGEHGYMFAKGDESRRLFDVLEETCENAVALDCPMLMTSPGQHVGTIDAAIDNIKYAADICGKYGLRLAVEFSWSHPTVNGLAPVRELIASADRPNLGLLLDAYHLQRGGEGGASFADIAPEEIFAFQFSDVPPEGSGPATLTDRLLPGKGIVRWIDVFRLLNVKNFGGFLSFEGPHPDTWARPPLDVCREAVAATRALIAQALTPAG